MTHGGLSERHALRVIGMSASSYRYAAAADRNEALREQIVALAQRHRRYGSGMVYLKLRQSGLVVNHKRVERLYARENLQVRRRKRKKVPVSERQPLGRPSAANQMWSMDFVFDRTAEGRAIKNLTIVDNATQADPVLKADPFDLIQTDVVTAPVVELRSAGRRVIRHHRGVLKRTAVFEIRGDASRAEGVITDQRVDAGRSRSAAHHRVGRRHY